MHKIDWSDLQFILAVAHARSLAGAARELGVNHSTVLRRINAFEQANAVRLFDRQRHGYSLTTEGQQMLIAAQSVENIVNSLERRIAGQDLRLEGTIRVTTTDSFLFELVNPHLMAFKRQYPDIVINVTVTNQLLNLTQRAADVAIRPGSNVPSPLVGEKIADLGFALYASPSYWSENNHQDYDRHDWIGLDDLLSESRPGRWMKKHVSNERIVFTADTFVALRLAAESGAGMAILPCFLGDRSDHLVRTTPPIETCKNGAWVLTHKDLINTTRIKVFADYMVEALRGEAARLCGTQ
jgi:DNA-binding transcriptional LysR family regulator